ncbi:sulfurtransferase TusA family protein [Desulfocurvus sp. DL9XJH121]
MSETVDARGLSCPQPVLDTLSAIDRLGSGRITVLLDTEASKENVSRAATGKGWAIESLEEQGDEYALTIAKG